MLNSPFIRTHSTVGPYHKRLHDNTWNSVQCATITSPSIIIIIEVGDVSDVTFWFKLIHMQNIFGL